MASFQVLRASIDDLFFGALSSWGRKNLEGKQLDGCAVQGCVLWLGDSAWHRGMSVPVVVSAPITIGMQQVTLWRMELGWAAYRVKGRWQGIGKKRKIGMTTVTNPSVPKGGEEGWDGWMQSRCVTAQLLQLNQSQDKNSYLYPLSPLPLLRDLWQSDNATRPPLLSWRSTPQSPELQKLLKETPILFHSHMVTLPPPLFSKEGRKSRYALWVARPRQKETQLL